MEWETALACDKPLLPILRLGEHADLPGILVLEGSTYRQEAFGRQHTPDFRDDNQFDARFSELLRLLAKPVQPMSALSALTPSIAPHVLPRGELIRPLVQSLLGTADEVTQARPSTDDAHIAGSPVVALVGMGGSGKTCLAASVVRVAAVRRHFSGGVVWLQAPQNENAGTIGALLDMLAQALGLSAAQRSQEEGAKAALRQTLHGGSWLLVLDDVFERDSPNTIRSLLGPACRLLVTTRQADVAHGLDAKVITVPVLQRSDSLRLLARWGASPELVGGVSDGTATYAGEAAITGGEERFNVAQPSGSCAGPGSGPDIAVLATVAELLGDHPLALAMAGASVRGQGSGAWHELVELLRAEGPGVLGEVVGTPVGDYAYRSVAAALHASVARLRQPQDRAHLLSLALFPPSTRLPLPMLQRYLGTAGLTPPLAGALLRRLQAAALLTLEEDGTASLHPLVADSIGRTSDTPAAVTLHRRWLHAYAPPEPAAWSALAVPQAEASYFWAHWGHHLAAAGETALIIHLATEVAWFSQSINASGLAQTFAQWRALPDAEATRPVLDVMTLCGPRAGAAHFDWLFECLARVPTEQASFRQRLAEQAAARPGHWARPLAPSLARAGSVLISTLKGMWDQKLSAVMWLDNERVITVGYDGLLTAWHATEVRELAQLNLFPGEVLHATSDTTKRRVYWCNSACHIGCVEILTDPSSGALTLVPRWRMSVDTLDATAPPPDPACKDLAAAIADSASRHLLAVQLMTWHGRNLLLAVASDGSVHSFDPTSGELLDQQMLAPASYAPYHLVSMAPLGGNDHTTGREGIIVGFGGSSDSHLLILCAPHDPLATSLDPWPSQPTFALCGDQPAAVRLFDSPGRLGAVAVSADGQCMAYASWSSMQQGGGVATIIATPWGDGGGDLFSFTLPSRGVRHLLFGAERLLVICHLDSVIDVVDLAARRNLGRHNCNAGSYCTALSPNGQWLASVHDDAALRLWDGAMLRRQRGRETWHHQPIVALALARTHSLWHTYGHVLRRLNERAQGTAMSAWSVLGTALRRIVWPTRELLAFCEAGELSRWDLRSYEQVFSNTLETALAFGRSEPYRTGRFDRDGALLVMPAARRARHRGETRRDALWLDVMRTSTLRFQRRLLTRLRVRGEGPGEGNCPVAISPGGRVIAAKPDRELLVWHSGRRREMGGWWSRWRDRHLTSELLVQEKRGTDDGASYVQQTEPCLQMSFSTNGRWLGLLFRFGIDNTNTLGLIPTRDLRRPHTPLSTDWNGDWTIKLRYAMRSEPQGRLPPGVEAFVMNHRASEVWLATGDGGVARWTPSSASVQKAPESAGHAPRQLALLADEHLLAVTTGRGVALYDSTSLQRLWIVGTEVAVTAIAALDGRRFALGFGDGRVCFFEWVPT